ncbi:mandelate racemase [Allopusillimonas ginsengisoli]|nr:mandelate racemase [Allopusillimonas ginsengisoli]
MPRLHIAGIKLRFVKPPMRFPLGTSAAVVTAAPLLLVDLQTHEGIIGRSYLFCYRDSGAKAIAGVLQEAVDLVRGHAVVPLEVGELLSRRYALLGVTGIVRMALAALDIALWDALAVAANMPLARFLGAPLRSIPAYNSDGLGLMPAHEAASEAQKLLEPGYHAIKLRLGHREARKDIEVARAVRDAIGSHTDLMVDYNQALTVPEAIQRGHELADLNIYWLEEQICHSNVSGYAQISRSLTTPIQLGENLDGPESVHRVLAESATDYLMLDVARIGGVSGWLRAAAIAAVHDIPVSSHLFPEISVHLLAATPNAHWLEYVSWADAVLLEPLSAIDGVVTPPERPGLGLEWSEPEVKRWTAD